MNKIMKIGKRHIIGVMSVYMLFAVNVFAQQDRYAKTLLDEVSKKYDNYKTIQANFTFKALPADGSGYDDRGTLFLNKSTNQYRINLENQEILSDGKSVWSVIHDYEEVQINEADSTSDAIGPTNLFTFYKNGFKYLTMDDEREAGKLYNVIELSPNDTQKNYFKIKLRINQNKHIHDVTIFDKSGARYTYTIDTLYVNHVLPSSRFTFEKGKYPNYEVVDLR